MKTTTIAVFVSGVFQHADPNRSHRARAADLLHDIAVDLRGLFRPDVVTVDGEVLGVCSGDLAPGESTTETAADFAVLLTVPERGDLAAQRRHAGTAVEVAIDGRFLGFAKVSPRILTDPGACTAELRDLAPLLITTT